MAEKTISPGLLRFLEENYVDDNGHVTCPLCAARDELARERSEIIKLLEDQVAKYQRLFPPVGAAKNAGTGSACTSGQKSRHADTRKMPDYLKLVRTA